MTVNHEPEVMQSLRQVLSSKDFVELVDGDQWALDLRYASSNNFVGQDMYGPFRRAFLHRVAFEKLRAAVALLQKRRPQFRFLIFDALRPRSVQRILWSHVVGTPNEIYIGHPDRGSMHNFGFAVDLTVLNEDGLPLDMGAGYDDFRDIAQPQLEDRFLAQGHLTATHLANRHLLRDVLEMTGWSQLPHEWWHFEALERETVRTHYTIVE